MAVITATELKKSLGFYLSKLKEGEAFIITKDGVEIGHLVPNKQQKIDLFNSFVGIAASVDFKKVKEERIKKL